MNPHRQGKLDCPTCRMPMGQGQSLLALTVVKNALHECRLQGCNVLQNTMDTELHSHLMLYKADAYSRIDLDFKTKIIQTEQGFVFFVRFGRKRDIYMIDVVMKGSKEDCKEVEVEASI